MKLSNDYRFENVWINKSDALQTEILDFWIEHGALGSREKGQARLSEVIKIARTVKDDKLVAVSTVYSGENPQLKQNFFYFRCFVAENHRRARLALFLIRAVYSQLNDRFVAGLDPDVIGLMMEVQNDKLQQYHRPAVWTRTGMVFIGYNARGDQVRVNYFDGAQIR